MCPPLLFFFFVASRHRRRRPRRGRIRAARRRGMPPGPGASPRQCRGDAPDRRPSPSPPNPASPPPLASSGRGAAGVAGSGCENPLFRNLTGGVGVARRAGRLLCGARGGWVADLAGGAEQNRNYSEKNACVKNLTENFGGGRVEFFGEAKSAPAKLSQQSRTTDKMPPHNPHNFAPQIPRGANRQIAVLCPAGAFCEKWEKLTAAPQRCISQIGGNRR